MQKTQGSDRRGKIPAYIQVAAALRRRVENGGWKPSEQISTLEELEEEFQVARVTVRQAVDLLEREGLVKRQQGRGTFVTDFINDKRWLKLETSWDSVVASIKESVPHFIKVANPPILPRLHAGDGTPADKYVFLRSVQLKDDIPYAVASVHIAKAVFDRRREKFLKHTALPILASMNLKIQHAHQTLVIGTADPEIAELLQVSLSAPTAEVRWVVRDEADTAIYVADITYRADCIKMSIDFFESVGGSAAVPIRRAA
ncbi:MAG TPA: GntR family transcriptional regulator [Ramlibacter sp.]|nr:GntR family transcriptional regulator [Ramlibacter sp.]